MIFSRGQLFDSNLNLYLGIAYAAYFATSCAMDYVLWRGLGTIDPVKMSVIEVPATRYVTAKPASAIHRHTPAPGTRTARVHGLRFQRRQVFSLRHAVGSNHRSGNRLVPIPPLHGRLPQVVGVITIIQTFMPYRYNLMQSA